MPIAAVYAESVTQRNSLPSHSGRHATFVASVDAAEVATMAELASQDGSSWARWVKKPFGHDGIEKRWIADIYYTHMSCRYSLWCRAAPGKYGQGYDARSGDCQRVWLEPRHVIIRRTSAAWTLGFVAILDPIVVVVIVRSI
jgi:hypothetical protein